MKRRHKLSKAQSKRSFKRGNRSHPKNSSGANLAQRGGIRL